MVVLGGSPTPGWAPVLLSSGHTVVHNLDKGDKPKSLGVYISIVDSRTLVLQFLRKRGPD